MNNKLVYAVVYEGAVSSEGYDTIDKAFEHIIGVCGAKQVQGWLFKDTRGKEYKIREIKIV